MNEQKPYYSKNLQDSLNGMYGHNILESGETSEAGVVFSSITATSGCEVSYDKYTGINSGGGNVTDLTIPAGATTHTGAITNVRVTGLGAKALLQILYIS